ncbi:MAG: SWIM zinc finger family protein [Pirellulaceae bacterium]
MARYRNEFGYGGWPPYVSVAQRRRQAAQKMAALRKKGVDIQPVTISGRKIASSFWGEAWCEHLESFSDFENRLPRGRTYVRNGSVCHMAVSKGQIEAQVCGSELYRIKIQMKTLPGKKWTAIKKRCSGQIGSLLELLQGKLSDHVMEVVTDRQEGLFPRPGDMSFSCSCPDWASMCKHVAAVLYGIGARLDTTPELLFTLRGVNHQELIDADAEKAVAAATSRGKSKRLAAEEIGAVFGIEIDAENPDDSSSTAPATRKSGQAVSRNKKVSAKKEPAAPVAGKRNASMEGKVSKPATKKAVKKSAAATKLVTTARLKKKR